MIKELWKGLGRAARIGLVVGLVLIVGGTALLGWWLLRADYQVLFTDLAPQDGAAMVAELERLKIPYSLSDNEGTGGATILVDRADVHRTRLKLMGKDIPLHGAVGFELFNNSDFGMTEFAQRINYQRALQGELTRTILALSEIRDARVLLALPEQTLFKQANVRGKASVTLTLKSGRALRAEQVLGIQRLVSAAVPGIAFDDVTIVDQSGVALTRGPTDGEAGAGVAAGRFDLKKDTEQYLARKAGEVLERALGAGQALASVDVTLDMNRVQTTTDDVLPSQDHQGKGATGVVVRERVSAREVGAVPGGGGADLGGGPVAGSNQREVEYVVGHRVEQVIGQPGSIKRLHVVAVVKRALDARQQEQIARMVGASVGASADRGDTVVVQSIDAIAVATGAASMGAPAELPRGAAAAAATQPAREATEPAADASGRGWWAATVPTRALWAGIGLAIAVALLAWLLPGWPDRRRAADQCAREEAKPHAPARELSAVERQAALLQVQAWLRDGSAGRAAGRPS